MSTNIKIAKFDDFIDKKYIPLEKRVKIAIFIILLIVPAVLFFFLSYQPQAEKITSLEKQVRTASEELKKVQQIAKDLPRHQKELKEIQEEFDSMAVLLPKSQEIPNLLRDISDLGKNTGLEFLTFTPGTETPKDFYAEIPIDITIKGPYHNLGLFLDKVSKLERIVTVNNIKMDKPAAEGGEVLLNSTCRLVTYRFTNQKLEPTDGKGKAAAKKAPANK